MSRRKLPSGRGWLYLVGSWRAVAPAADDAERQRRKHNLRLLRVEPPKSYARGADGVWGKLSFGAGLMPEVRL